MRIYYLILICHFLLFKYLLRYLYFILFFWTQLRIKCLAFTQNINDLLFSEKLRLKDFLNKKILINSIR